MASLAQIARPSLPRFRRALPEAGALTAESLADTGATSIAAVPEPGAAALLGIATLGIMARRRRRSNH